MVENQPQLELADVENTKSWYSGKTITRPHICTATDSKQCHIFKELATWNEFLFYARMELKEERPGKLRLVWTSHVFYDEIDLSEGHFAATLAFWLLAKHRCVASFDVRTANLQGKHKKLIACALQSSALKKLRIQSYLGAHQEEVIASTLHRLTELEQLDWEDYARISTPDCGEPLCSLVRNSLSLSTLSLPGVVFTNEFGQLLIRALGTSTTIKKLVLNSTVVTPYSGDNTAAFGEYLENNKVLTTFELNKNRVLTMDEFNALREKNGELKSVLISVSRSHSLLNVCFRNYRIDEEGASALETYLTHNDTLTWFGLKNCFWYQDSPDDIAIEELSYRIKPWLKILATNHSLQGLQLAIDAFSPFEWDAFCEVLMKNNTTLKQIIIEDLFGTFPPQYVYGICQNLTARNLADSVSNYPGVEMWCDQYYKLNIPPPNLRGVPSEWNIGLSLRPGDVTTNIILSFIFPVEQVGSLVASYIEETRVLTDLELEFMFIQGTAVDEEASKFRKRVFTSLLRNNTIKSLRVEVVWLTDEEITLFASALVSHRQIVELCIGIPDELAGPFVEKLSPGFVENFSVISFPFPRPFITEARIWFPIMEVARRNLSLVVRAAHFVAGHRDRGCAKALEAVSSSPALVDKLCELLSVGKEEAEKKVRTRVNDLQDISGFFLSSGVVKAELSCYESQGFQLMDVDEYSWLAVRKFLTVGDVVDDEQQRTQ